MSRIGRALREAMRPDAPGAASERVHHRRVAEQAHAEMLERFAPLTAETAAAAIEWQERRIRELKGCP